MKKNFTVNKSLIMSKEEIEVYNALPSNLPETVLNKAQKDLVSNLYYKYITKIVDNKDWSSPMYKVEQKENWPSGPRMKEHEAKRIVLKQPG